MTPSSIRPRSVLLLAAASATSAMACGASINAVYEGDVRFEHCMAIDERPGELAESRRSCWDEWYKYYTFGQTRDRVDYARLRRKQLSDKDDPSRETWTPSALAQRVVPEPTTVLAPPPLTLEGPKPPEPAASAVPVKSEVVEPPAAACSTPCRDTWNACKQSCTGPACDKCVASYKRCMKKCF